ncbi:Copper chaperone CopZ [Cnuella takakiae]|uniref:Copper chaperone CopZ n=1 Tax=Cnuella takakiae TaxID=1302690 RepID=A0A1M5DDF9_9BACT|nr:hypothetical protein [Cnuella takakiae]OLY94011.1 hypothetical protein BUE76_20570 [Cnuella takakiae]SHF64911.1 Copper chaperone CopZ [Cnuella takakiae]
MKTLQFTTNINCNCCVAAVKPLLDKESRIQKWHVATGEPQKTLTIETEELNTSDIQSLVGRAGFNAQPR